MVLRKLVLSVELAIAQILEQVDPVRLGRLVSCGVRLGLTIILLNQRVNLLHHHVHYFEEASLELFHEEHLIGPVRLETNVRPLKLNLLTEEVVVRGVLVKVEFVGVEHVLPPGVRIREKWAVPLSEVLDFVVNYQIDVELL